MTDLKYLVRNKAELIRMKKAELKTCKGGLSKSMPSNVNKGMYENNNAELKRTIIGNTYLWMDRHDDVHAKGCFKKSIKESNAFHLHDHEFKLLSRVGEPIKVYEDYIDWKDLGVDKIGATQALFMDTSVLKSYNERIYDLYKEDKINQHSVGMLYVKIDLAVNDEDSKEEYKNWLEFIEQLGNKERAEEKGYFWIVREAKLIEISAVLMASNSLTPTISEPQKSTRKNEPSDDTQKAIYYQTFLN